MAAFASIHETNSILLNTGNDSNPLGSAHTLTLGYPLSLRDNYIALANLFIFNSVANLTSAYGNNVMQIIWPGSPSSPFTMTIPTGYYSIVDINDYIHFFLLQNNLYLINASGTPVFYISFALNQILYGFTITILPLPTSLPAGWSFPPGATWTLDGTGNTPQVVIPPNTLSMYTSMGKILGFPTATYPPAPITTEYQFTSSTPPAISPVSSINVLCNLVTTSYFNSSPQVIYCFNFNVAYGEQQVITPPYLCFFKCQDAQFNQITVSLTDQHDQPLALIDPDFIVQLYLVQGKGNLNGK